MIVLWRIPLSEAAPRLQQILNDERRGAQTRSAARDALDAVTPKK